MPIEFNTTEYQFSHGKTPSGRGSWAFEIKGKIVFAPGETTYTDAKKFARAKAQEANVSRVKVCP